MTSYLATYFGVKIGKIGLFTFINSPGIPKWIAKVSSVMIWLHHRLRGSAALC